MSRIIVGIDLGTSTSEICYYKNGKTKPINDPDSEDYVVPSVVAVDNGGKIIVGESAKSRPNAVFEIKRERGSGKKLDFDGKSFYPEELEAHILKKLIKNAEDYLGEKIDEAVITVPANFPEPARQATYNIGKLAGIKVLRLINEPTAAALAYGMYKLSDDEHIAVFDFGGGTLDISILEMMEGILDVKVSSGNPQLGGKDIDKYFMEYIKNRFLSENPGASIIKNEQNQINFKLETEKLKKKLSTIDSGKIYIPNFARRNGSYLDLELYISRNEFNNAIVPVLEEVRECIRTALKKSMEKDIKKEDIKKVLLVGGSSRIPIVQEIVMEEFGTGVDKSIPPDLAVSMGAAIQCAILKGEIDPDDIMIMDVSPFGMGVECLDIVNGSVIPNRYSPLMPINTPIPYSVKKRYSLLHEEQDAVVIKLYQDSTGHAHITSDEGVVFTGIEGKIDNIPKSENGVPHPIDVEFSYNANGMIELKAYIPTLENKKIEIKRKLINALNIEDDTTEIKNDIVNSSSKTNDYGEYGVFVSRAEELINSSEGDEYLREELRDILDKFKKAWDKQDTRKIERYGEKLMDKLADF